jgi:hypothetical protein
VRHVCFLSSSLWENTHEQPRRSGRGDAQRFVL